MADEAEAQAAPLDHEMVADNALLGQTLQAREQGMGPAEVRVGGEHRRHPVRLRGHADGPAEAVRSEVERRGSAAAERRPLQPLVSWRSGIASIFTSAGR